MTGSGGAAPVRAVPYRAGPDLSAQVHRAHREMVDADLRADAGGPVPADGERGAGPAHAAGTLGAQLLQQPRPYELVDEGRHGGAGQPDTGGDRGPRQRALGTDGVHDPGQIAPAHALLGVGQRASRSRRAGLVQRCGHA
ncbi:hypothetical protein GCM10020256_68000 [Streptomyces thermocoprophilus]